MQIIEVEQNTLYMTSSIPIPLIQKKITCVR